MNCLDVIEFQVISLKILFNALVLEGVEGKLL